MTITAAGRKMLDRYAAARDAGELRDLTTLGGGTVADALRLYRGCGADAACARKLARDGLANVHEGGGWRYITLTDAGRTALTH